VISEDSAGGGDSKGRESKNQRNWEKCWVSGRCTEPTQLCRNVGNEWGGLEGRGKDVVPSLVDHYYPGFGFHNEGRFQFGESTNHWYRLKLGGGGYPKKEKVWVGGARLSLKTKGEGRGIHRRLGKIYGKENPRKSTSDAQPCKLEKGPSGKKREGAGESAGCIKGKLGGGEGQRPQVRSETS